MKKLVIFFIIGCAAFAAQFSSITEALTLQNTVQKTTVAATTVSAYPFALAIPSINLSSPVQLMGLTNNGEMAVPSGKTKNVGWYEYGTIPGNMGSAVLDAHVFAAFSNLKKLKVGSDIYVTAQDGSRLHFVVSKTKTYALADVPREDLFNRNDGRYLNLITCAGKLTPDHSTYDHRLIVYAQLATNPNQLLGLR